MKLNVEWQDTEWEQGIERGEGRDSQLTNSVKLVIMGKPTEIEGVGESVSLASSF